jgi:hypothetical protein
MERATKDKEIEYHMNSFICFSGAHYYIFVAEKRANGSLTKRWRLYNDTFNEKFDDWYSVVNFCITSKSVPTVLMYEATTHASENEDRYILTAGKLEALQIAAMD